MAYCTFTDLANRLGGMQNLIPFTDDTGTGQLDSNVLDGIISQADSEIDGYIGAVYSTPVSPVVPKLRTCSIVFSCEMLFQRRLAPGEKNLYTDEATRLRDDLRRIGEGELNLDVNAQRAFAQVSAVTRSTIYGADGSNSPANTM